MQLFQHIPCNQWFKLFIDNFYTGVPLATTLINQGIGIVGTVRPDSLRNCHLSTDKIMLQKGRRVSINKDLCESQTRALITGHWISLQLLKHGGFKVSKKSKKRYLLIVPQAWKGTTIIWVESTFLMTYLVFIASQVNQKCSTID